jgi:hypothetical protein
VDRLVDGAFGEAAHPEEAFFDFVEVFFEVAFHLILAKFGSAAKGLLAGGRYHS